MDKLPLLWKGSDKKRKNQMNKSDMTPPPTEIQNQKKKKKKNVEQRLMNWKIKLNGRQKWEVKKKKGQIIAKKECL